ncbi:MAG: dephospho-CoA kinase [Crocinitomicaceae bacterium]|nr:dephospho-CoA kinase [Crocinitomicaceae bacterium]
MLKIGITGGIGSGKSLVSRVLESMGYPVFNSDNVAKDIVANNSEVRKGLIELFGKEIYDAHGLNKVRLAEYIFSDNQARLKVNAIIHPKVREAFQKFAEASHSKIVFNEAAILFETGSYKQLDATILVVAPEELRINRVIERDNALEATVIARIEKQWSDEKKASLTPYVIVNDEKQPLLHQVEKIIEQLIIPN